MVNLELSGRCVDRISFDYAVTLLLDGGVDIRVETQLSLRIASGRVMRIDPERAGADAEHILSVLHGTVTHAIGQDGGTLEMEFEGGARIEVAPNERYEAWMLAGPRGWKVVAMPGGGLASWDPQP